MLENPANRNGWPEMVSEDVSHQLYSLRGTVYRMWGQLRGQTLLPLPFGMDTLEKAERHALDTQVLPKSFSSCGNVHTTKTTESNDTL